MVGGVVITDRGVHASGRNVEVVVVGILQNVTFQVDAEVVHTGFRLAVDVAVAPFKNNLAQEFEFLGDIRGNKQIELAQGKRGGIAVLRVATEVDVAKPTNAQQGFAQVHPLGHY